MLLLKVFLSLFVALMVPFCVGLPRIRQESYAALVFLVVVVLLVLK